MSKDWLRRRLGVFDIYSLVHADSQSTFYFILGVIAAAAGKYTFWAVLYGTALMAAIALAYGEMGSRFPETGGSYLYVKTALGPLAGFFSAWLLAFDQAIMVAYGSLDGSLYLFDMLSRYGLAAPPIVPRVFSFAIAVLLFLLTLIGIKESARFSAVIATLDIILVGILTLGLGLALGLKTNPPYFSWPSVGSSDVLTGLSYASRGYTGVDAIGQLAGEAEMPLIQVPQATLLVIGLGAAYGIGLTALMMDRTSYWDIVRHPATAVLAIAASLPLGRLLTLPIGVVMALIQIMAALAGYVAFSRLLYRLAVDGHLPPLFSRLHKKYRTPHVSLSLILAMAIALLIPGEIYLIVDIYAIGSLINYIMVSLALIIEVRKGGLYGALRSPTIAGISLVGLLGVALTSAGLALAIITKYREIWILALWVLAGLALLKNKRIRPIKQ
ncbi:MAG: APC family permease [Thermoproteus sp. AZ2]|uniref:APC family permease n=1 Tax=Thermoproteus sp. AZ2 TaxID=1609232 RepID=A0ACC6UZG6_9CREN